MNRFEVGEVRYSHAEFAAYELAVGVVPGFFLDPLLHLARLEGARHPLRAAGQMDSLISSVQDVASGKQLSARDWVVFAAAYSELRARGLEIRSAFPDATAQRLLSEFEDAYEVEERFLGDAIAQFGANVATHVVERVEGDSIRTFNLIEAVGRMYTSESAALVSRMASSVLNDITAQTLFESYRRNLGLIQSQGVNSDIRMVMDIAAEVILDENAAYTAREEAYALVASGRPGDIGVKLRKYYQQAPTELLHLVQGYASSVSKRLLREVLAGVRLQMEARRLVSQSGAVVVPAGLSFILEQALFSPERSQRIAHALLISKTPVAGAVAVAAASLVGAYAKPYPGLARSLIRLVTKIQSRDGEFELYRQTLPPHVDEGVLLSLAWGAGSTDVDTEGALASYADLKSGLTTQKVVLLSASRRSYSRVLEKLSQSSYAEIKNEAAIELGLLRGRVRTGNPMNSQ
ncbi:hypothetical protein [Pseudoclavibacter helvolus]|uniref:hypothetical protein n=1 Tax=Pseudoclavibacter helvolus TaxID=255205 RepID=UPI0037368E0A